MMNIVARTPSHVSSSTSVSPVKRSYGSQDPWNPIAKKEERSRRLDNGTDLFEASDHHYHEQFLKSFSSASYSKSDDDRAWSSQEWKTEINTYERSARPDKTSWKMIRKVRPGQMQSADRALHGSGIQLHSQRMELYQANQLTDQSQKEKSWLCTDLEMRERALQEDRVKSYQEIEDLKRICCTEAERARKLRIDELSTQEEESKATVNQLVVQNSETTR